MPGPDAEPEPPLPPDRPEWQPPAGVRRSHTGHGLVFLLILGVLVAGLYLAVARPLGSSLVARRGAPGSFVATGPPTATVAPGSGGSPIAVLTTTAAPEATPEPSTATPPVAPSPAAAATAPASAAPRASAAPMVATATPPAGSRVHTVQAGDTLSALAQRYGSTVEAIMRANGIPARNTPLRIGQRLVVPPS